MSAISQGQEQATDPVDPFDLPATPSRRDWAAAAKAGRASHALAKQLAGRVAQLEEHHRAVVEEMTRMARRLAAMHAESVIGDRPGSRAASGAHQPRRRASG